MKTPKTNMFCFSCIFFVLAAAAAAAPVPVKVGVVLDMDMWDGKLGLSCINMALSDFYNSNHINGSSKFRLDLVVRDSKKDIVGAAAAALDLIKNEQVHAIIGPRSSMQSNFIIDLGNKSHVPIISFSATSPSLTSIRSPHFFRATQNDSSQVKAISAIVQAFGWRQAVAIYVDNEFGEGILPYLSDALEEVGARIPYRTAISPVVGDEEIKEELYKLMTMQTRVFIVHTDPEIGARIFDIAMEIGMMEEGYVWIITDGMMNQWSLMGESHKESMQGVLGVRAYVPRSEKLYDLTARWKRKFLQDNPTMDVNVGLDIFGVRAYDATFELAMAVEKLITSTSSSSSSDFSFSSLDASGNNNSKTDLESFGVSRIGPQLIQALSSIRFPGRGGEFGFTNGQLDTSVFRIMNVNGNGEKRIGFWTSRHGLVKKMTSFTNQTEYSTSRENLKTNIWPGDSHSVPKGWEIPTNEKKLKILVPVNSGFSEFIKVIPNASTAEGYCIDVFRAVMDVMPYAVPYELIPFAKPNSTTEMNGTYDNLIYQVFLRKYDAVVGDVSIVLNRSSYVDFTLPFTESGVVMVVPIKPNSNKNAWVFLMPLSRNLWITIGCFFVFIGFVIWVLEHRINRDFRGPPSNHIGTSFWFSFSTMAFAHRERVQSNAARFVVVIWCFVVLILTQSYTASLTSLLTVEQLKPMETDVNQLLKTGKNIGYPDGSFVKEKLIGLGFEPNKMKIFDSPEQLHELFSNGSITAAFDEIPYMKLFLGKYCDKYTNVGQIFKTDGFGFVFPKGSPLVADVSRAILNVTEGDNMKKFEKAWIQNQSDCPDSSTMVSSNSLDVGSFGGLFLIAGVSGMLALVVFAAEFLYQQKDVLLDSTTSLKTKILEMSRKFDDKDLTSHTFTDSPQLQDAAAAAVEAASPNANCPPSPSSMSSPADYRFAFVEERGRPSINHDEDRAAETELQTKFPYGGVILRPGFIHGTRSVGTMKIPLSVIGTPLEMVLQHAKPLNQIPVVGPMLTPPVKVTAVAKVAVRGATDPVFPPGIIDVYGIERYSQQKSR